MSSELKRCPVEGCNKKLKLTDFPCRCGITCCMTHRSSELHACTYDYKKEYKVSLEKVMQPVTAKKLETV